MRDARLYQRWTRLSVGATKTRRLARGISISPSVERQRKPGGCHLQTALDLRSTELSAFIYRFSISRYASSAWTCVLSYIFRRYNDNNTKPLSNESFPNWTKWNPQYRLCCAFIISEEFCVSAFSCARWLRALIKLRWISNRSSWWLWDVDFDSVINSGASGAAVTIWLNLVKERSLYALRISFR